ncbi:DUF6345 domain-containing protein [Catellatospora sp. NPDC049609]|uniref:DUF6345 domain-containing protein n=1 Tax=Catellatospora sp. NPDC049609 TaxID=3155505 RepID=UPI0034127FBF
MSLLSTLSKDAAAAPTMTGGTAMLQSGPLDPAAESTAGAGADVRAGQDMYFFTSIEDFPDDIGDLSLTHDDVQGFYEATAHITPPNGWYRDGEVGQWIYEETYDNHLDEYGFDAARVVYHSGHGSMDDAGVFWLPVGNDWGGDFWTSSNDMRLGNEHARYVFWSTCQSLRVKDGHDPIRTWSVANLGLRMIFGYETISYDNGNYGRFFFEEYNLGKSFSTAFLDASWRISTSQEPSVVACGATQAEAQDRLFNEWQFHGDRADTTWWWWRWYDAARARARNLLIPEGARSAKLAPAVVSRPEFAAFAARFDVGLPGDMDETAMRRGIMLSGNGGTRIALGRNGSREVRLAQPADTRRQISADQAIAAAQQAIEQYRLAQDVDLILDHVRYDRHAGASADERAEAAVREVTVSFVQVIDGVPVVSPDSGRVHVRVDNDGTVTGIMDSTRQVQEVRDRAVVPPPPDTRRSRGPQAGPASAPSENGVTGGMVTGVAAVDAALDAALQRRLRRIAAGGRVASGVRAVPNTTEVGYAMRDGDAVLVARREVEIDFGHGLAKRYAIEEPIVG